jgi:alkylhydroperoxidase family enzyme
MCYCNMEGVRHVSRIPDAPLTDEVPEVMHNNLHRALYNNPELNRCFMGLAMGVHQASHLPTRTRELVILRISAMLGAEVEWAQHLRLALAAGVSREEARAMREGLLAALPPEERAAVAFAEAVDRCGVDDEVWATAVRHHTPVQLLDLTLLAAFYALASRVTLALDIEVDEGLTRMADLDAGSR